MLHESIVCSGYFVDGFLVDTCIHWLMGTKKGNFINDLWREIGGLGRKVKIISLPTLGTIEYEGVSVTFYRDLDKAEKELEKTTTKKLSDLGGN